MISYPTLHHSEAEEWLILLQATLPIAIEAHRKHDSIIPFGGYLRHSGEIVWIGHPEVLPPTTGLFSWVIQELQRHKEEARVVIYYSDVFYHQKPALQLSLESATQYPTQLIYQLSPPTLCSLKSTPRRIW